MDYKDYVDVDADSKPVEASSPYGGYVDIDSLEEAKPAEKSSGMGYLDPVKGAAAGAAGDLAAAATGAQVLAEKAGYPTAARMARGASMGLHRAEEAINESITPEGRAAQGAALIPNQDQEQLGAHPMREAAMKGTSIAAPAAVGVVGGTLGAMIAGPAGAAAGTAGAGALYGLAKGVDQAVAWTNDLNDDDLAKEAPVFGKFKQMYLEENIGKGMDQQAADKQASFDARTALHDGLYGIKQAAFDAGTNALAFGAGRKVLTGLGGSRLTDYVLSGGSLGAVSASSDVNQQNVDITKKGEGQVDPFQTAIAFLNGTAEGVAFHGAGEGAKKLASWSGFKKAETPTDDKKVVNTPESAAPSTGEVPKGARTGEAPPPNESAQEGQIGNPQSAPTRDQETPAATEAKKTSKKRGKKTKLDATVTVLDENAPPPAETQALQQSTPGAPDTVQLAEPPKPAPDPMAVTPEVTAPEATAPEISPQNEVPEAAPTIDAQVSDFFDKKRDVIRFNNPDQVPAEKPTGVRQHTGSDGSVWWHRPRKVPQGKIEQAIKGKTENELLGLGPHTKEDVQADVAAGGQELAAVARDENGVETAAAATTDNLAPETLKAVQEANPDKTVTLEQPEQVIEGRLNGTGAAEAPVVEVPTLFDEKAARREATRELRTAKPKVDAEGRRILPPAVTEENIRAGVETRRKEWEIEQEKAAADKRRADLKATEDAEEAKKNAPPAPPADFKSQKNPGRDRARTENRTKSDALFEEHKGGMSTEGRAARITRLNTILEAAKERGISIPQELDYEKHSAGQAFLKEAQLLVRKARAATKTKMMFPSADDFHRFSQAEFDLRDGLEGYDRYKKNASAEGDAKFGVKFNEAYKKGGRQEAEDEGPTASADEFTGDDRESEGQATTLGDVAIDRPEVEEYRQEPTTSERPKVALKGNEITAGRDKAGEVGTKIKVEVKKDRSLKKPKVRGFNEDDLLAAMDPVEGRATGERDGFVSARYGSEAASTRIMRTEKVDDIFRRMSSSRATFAGKLFPLIKMRLNHLVGDVKVHVVDADELRRISGNSGARGFYKSAHRGEGGYIVLAHDIPPERMAHIFTHEALHAATEDALFRSPKLRGQINSIMEEAKAAFPEDLRTLAFTNESEFIAEAFSNARFQEKLASLQISAKLAKDLGLERRSLWSALVDRIREAINLPTGTYSALEALVRPVNEAMTANARIRDALYAGRDPELRPFIGDAAKEMIDKFDGSNLKDLYGRFKRGASSNTMLAMMGQKLGPKFGYLARKAVDLQQQMAVRTDNILRRKGGALELTREGDKLRNNPDTAADMDKAFDLGFKAREYNLDMTPGAKNEHIFGTSAKSDILNATQAKKAYNKLRSEIDSLHPEVKDWLEKSAKFFRDEDNTKREATIRRVLDATDVDKELAAAVVRNEIPKAEGTVDALAKRIFDGKMTEKDEALFKTNTIVKHLNEIANLKRLKGWYFPQEREGDYILSARKEFATPSGKFVHRVTDKNGQPTNQVIFTDPAGRMRDAPARRAAQDWMKQLVNDGMLAEAKKVYVLESDPTTIVSNAEANAIGAPKTFKAYQVEVMDEYFDLFKDPASRNAKAAELEGSGWGKVVQSVRKQNPNARFDGLVPSQVETMINSLQRRDKFTKLSEAQQGELIQSLRQATIRLLPGARIQHHNLQSRNVAGYSKDMINVLAKNAEQSARFQAKTELQPKINDVLSSMQDEIDLDKYSKKTEERQQVLRDLETRLTQGSGVSHEGFLNKTLDTLNKVSLIDKLFGPSFHFINAQEPWTTAAPIIGGRHGFVKTFRSMKDAYNMIGGRVNAVMPGIRDTGKAIRGESTDFTDYRANFKNEITKNIGGERAKRLSEVLDYLHDRNLFGHEAGMEVSRIADPAAGKFERALDRVDLVSRQFGQAVEAINRSVTALTSYELEYARTKNHQGAMRYAHDIVHDTMGNYSASNSAPAFNHPLGRAMLQFKKFAQKTYFLLGKTLGKAYEGDKEAKKALLGVLFTHGVVAGALGLPIEPIKAAVIASNALGVSPYSWDDIEAAIREEAAGMLGKKLGTAVTRGVPRAFLGYDASGRQGMADLLTGLGPRSSSGSDIKNWLFDTVAGPSLSMPIKWAENSQAAISSVAKGDYKGAASKALDTVPVKFVRDVARAGFGAYEGRKDKTGRELMAPYSPGEALLQAAGLTPSRRAEEAEMRSKFIGAEQDRNKNRRGLIADWVNATPEGKRDAMSAIQKYNKTVPGNATIKQNDLVSALKRRKDEKTKGTYDRGMRVTKQNRDIHDRMNQVYGD